MELQLSEEASRRSAALFIAVVASGLVAYNSVVFLFPAYTILYVPINVAAAAALVAVAIRFGLQRGDLGLAAGTVRSGLRWGGGVALIAAAGLAVVVAVPAFHSLLDDARVASIGVGLLLYRVLIRIPLGTVVLEELAFRGILFGAWSRLSGATRAAIGSSIVFGLWHIRPAIELLDANHLAESVGIRIPAVAAAVLLTVGGGLFFCFLRERSRSLVAPLVAHAAVNSLATVAAFLVRSS